MQSQINSFFQSKEIRRSLAPSNVSSSIVKTIKEMPVPQTAPHNNKLRVIDDSDDKFSQYYNLSEVASPKTIHYTQKKETPAAKQSNASYKEPTTPNSNLVDEKDSEFPYFLKPENLLDSQKRKPDDPDYDPSTLYVPLNELAKMTPARRQFWELKSKNFDKILLFKVGKFYEMYYDDAVICHDLLGLNWTGTLHVGFPEKTIDRYSQVLIDNGFKIAIAEHLETPTEMKERVKKTKNEKTIHREVCHIYSKGVYSTNEPNNRFLLAITDSSNSNHSIGLAFFDISTLQFYIVQLDDNEFYTQFRSLCTKIRPVEILYEKNMVCKQLLRILFNSPQPPQVTELRSKDCIKGNIIYERLEKYLGPKSKWPKDLLLLDKWEHALQSVGLCITLLEKMLLAEQSIIRFTFHEYNPNTLGTVMQLDSQAFQNLEVLEVPSNNGCSTEGSLLSIIDNTSTILGKRLIKRWICAPLSSVELINQRLDAVEELILKPSSLYSITTYLKKIPDIEKYASKLYKYGSSNALCQKAIYFEDVHSKKIAELENLLNMLEKVECLHSIIQELDLKAPFIKSLTEYDKCMPDPMVVVNSLKGIIKWGQNEEGEKIVLIPAGADESYDALTESINSIKSELQAILNEERKSLNCSTIKYVHSKLRYELEIPENIIKGDRKPANYDFTSKRSGFSRFHTSKIKSLVDKLDALEEKAKVAIAPFISNVFIKLYGYKDHINQIISCVAQIDCICALANVSANEGYCRPVFTDEPGLEFRDLKHPCLVKCTPQFIANDIVINREENKSSSILVVSGPNMGGKSTILRQTCIGVIMAQIGCYLPASKARMHVVDRIFTRIGASDRILEGHSTFYVELEEAKNIVDFATPNSLVIIDELGRGTSTYDGAAIAEAVLDYIAHQNKCMTLFSTHYRCLIERCKKMNGVKFYYMGSKEISKEEIMFSYKFIEGICPSSYGMNVARLAGIPQSIIERAICISKQMESKFNSKHY